MSAHLHILTYNIHKGFSPLNRRMMVHELRERLRHLDADIVFLQEVQGLHLKHAQRHDNWPGTPQHEFLAEAHWEASAYGMNMAYTHGHHGNAILSRFPILSSHNQDVTHWQFEKRGLLHCQVRVSPAQTVHCVCVHLSLLGHSRHRQMAALAGYLEKERLLDGPLIIAGDFNDWRNTAGHWLAERLGLLEVFGVQRGRPVASFPAVLPVFRLDRIYVRGLDVLGQALHSGPRWSSLSDHAALSAHLGVPGV